MNKIQCKKIMALLLTMVIVLVSFVGCGSSTTTEDMSSKSTESNTNTDEQTSEQANKKDVKLTFVGSQNWLNKGSKIDSELIDAFTEETGIKVDLQIIPDDQYVNVLKTKMATSEVPDIFMVGAGVGALKFMPDKYFADLSNEEWISRYAQYAKDGTNINGKTMGFMTWGVDGWGLLYNTSLFEKYQMEVPKTYEDLLGVCEVLKSNGITPIYEVGKEAWHWGIWFSQIGPLANKNNKGLYDKLNTNQAKFADVPEFETYLTQLKDLYEKGYLGEHCFSNSWDAAYEALGTEKAAMYIAYQSYQHEVMDKFPESNADEWKMFPIPLAGNNLYSHSAGGIMRVAYKDSKNLESVKLLFDFLAREDNLKKFYDGRSDIQANPSFVDVASNPTNAGRAMQEYATGGSGIEMEYGVLYWDNTAFGKYIQDMLIGEKTPKEVLESIDNDRAKMFAATAE